MSDVTLPSLGCLESLESSDPSVNEPNGYEVIHPHLLCDGFVYLRAEGLQTAFMENIASLKLQSIAAVDKTNAKKVITTCSKP